MNCMQFATRNKHDVNDYSKPSTRYRVDRLEKQKHPSLINQYILHFYQ